MDPQKRKEFSWIVDITTKGLEFANIYYNEIVVRTQKKKKDLCCVVLFTLSF